MSKNKDYNLYNPQEAKQIGWLNTTRKTEDVNLTQKSNKLIIGLIYGENKNIRKRVLKYEQVTSKLMWISPPPPIQAERWTGCFWGEPESSRLTASSGVRGERWTFRSFIVVTRWSSFVNGRRSEWPYDPGSSAASPASAAAVTREREREGGGLVGGLWSDTRTFKVFHPGQLLEHDR